MCVLLTCGAAPVLLTTAPPAGSTGSPKRLRVSVGKVKEDLVAGGLDSAGGYEYLRQPTDLVVLGKVTLAPAAQDIQVKTGRGGGGTGWGAAGQVWMCCVALNGGGAGLPTTGRLDA